MEHSLAAGQVLQQAVTLHRQGRLADAERLYLQVLRVQPDQFDALHCLGIVKAQQGSNAEAERLIVRALRVRPQAPEALSSLASVLSAAKRYDEALGAYQKALAVNPRDVGALLNRGNTLSELKRYPEALASYDQALALMPGNAAAHHNRASILRELKRFDEALTAFERALAIAPDYIPALNGRGRALNDLGRHEDAIACCAKAIALKPDYADAHYNVGNALYELGRHQEALVAYDKAIANKPDHSEAWFGRGNTLFERKSCAEAVSAYDKAIAIKPEFAEAWFGRGNGCFEIKRHDEAIGAFDRALAIDPGLAQAWAGRGNVLFEHKRYDEALAAHDRALGIKPDLAEAWLGRANVLYQLKRYDEALAAYGQAASVKRTSAKAACGRGNVLCERQRYDEAANAFENALATDPGVAEAWVGLANALLGLRRYEEASNAFGRAIAIDPAIAAAWFGNGSALFQLKNYEEALESYGKAVALQPDVKYGRGAVLLMKEYLCDWRNLEEHCRQIVSAVHAGSLAIDPFTMTATAPSPDDQLEVARLFVNDRHPESEAPLWRGERYTHDRIRIAYLSSDFREHAVACLVGGLFELHDKSRFETTALSFVASDNSEMRRRLERSFDRFVDVRTDSDQAVAELVRRLEIDIAIDMNGFTDGARTGIFARRPAPIQVNFIGYPGTMGAPYIDYIIADSTVIPDHQVACYSEQVVRLPDTYLANDAKRPAPGPAPSRIEAGLPERGIVFCSFNNSFKIAPNVFDVWMRLLRQVEGSVLWLREAPRTAVGNLRAEAEKRGVSADRLVFAARVRRLEEHFARHRLADLFLDTLPYNAHTTASDALWAGLPVITCLGTAFAGRVAASLLHAIGLPELITHSLDEYESLALKLAREPGLLAALKSKLSDNRSSCPLFNTERYVRHLEAAYATMWEIRQRGESPRSFRVEPVR